MMHDNRCFVNTCLKARDKENKIQIALWGVQVMVGLAFVLAAYSHGFRADQKKARPGGQ